MNLEEDGLAVRRAAIVRMPIEPSDLPRRVEEYEDTWWADKIPRLLAYAAARIGQRTWLGLKGGDPPGGVQAGDVVNSVLRKALEGKRRWDPDTQPNLYFFLKSQVDSEISNLVRKPENCRTRRISSGEPERGRYTVDDVPSPAEDPQDIVVEASEEEWFKKRLWHFVESLDDDHDLQYLVIAASEGAVKRRELAAALSVTETEIDNRMKRLKRRRREYQSREDQ